MDVQAVKSSVEHKTLGKLYKYIAKIDDENIESEVFKNTLFSGTEEFPPFPYRDDDFGENNPSLDHHKRYSNKKYSSIYCPPPMMMGCQPMMDPSILHIFKGSQENSIRLYLTDRNDLGHPMLQNRLCYLLGNLCDKKIDIYIGHTLLGNTPLCNLGCLFDALENSSADVTIHACGRCGMCESLLWLHGRNRCITQYGSLYFSGVGRILEAYPMWREYYSQCFSKAKLLGLITDQDVVDMLTTNNLIYISATDTMAALQK